jgi:hypothetical protein
LSANELQPTIMKPNEFFGLPAQETGGYLILNCQNRAREWLRRRQPEGIVMTTALADADWSVIPFHLQSSLRRYVDDGRIPGAFLTALLMNDGHEMVMRAPRNVSLPELRSIIAWCDQHLPPECFGKPERLADWEHVGGLNGLAEINDNRRAAGRQ